MLGGGLGFSAKMLDKHPLHALCPYFAMFPPDFARAQIARFTRPGEVVLDPFSGRGTTLLEASLAHRPILASDINPVAACITGAKASVPSLPSVHCRLDELRAEFKSALLDDVEEERKELPPFFKKAFHFRTLREVLFLRQCLDWQIDDVDRFIAALVLGSLHGEMDRSNSYFSNQMPRTISMKPDYSIRYWQKHKLVARRRRVFDLLSQRARLRLGQGRPTGYGLSLRRDVRSLGSALVPWEHTVQLVVTSPPYLNVTNFEEDQWLRLWFLGGAPRPTRGQVSKDDRYSNPWRYWQFLAEAWKGVAALLAHNAVIVCRLSGKNQTTDALRRGMTESVRGAFPDAQLIRPPLSTTPLRRQTDNFRPGTQGVGPEVDFVFRI